MGYFSGWDSRKQLTDHLKDSKCYAGGAKVVDHGGSGNFFYVLVERADGVTMIIQYLLSSYNGEWGYKPVEESAGPARVDNCPLRLIKKSTCTEGYAQSFKDRVIAHHEHKKKVRHYIKGLTLGDAVTLHNGELVKFNYEYSPTYFVGTSSSGDMFRYRTDSVKIETN